MYGGICLNFFEGTPRCEQKAVHREWAAYLPQMKPMRECRNSRGLLPANPDLGKTTVFERNSRTLLSRSIYRAMWLLSSYPICRSICRIYIGSRSHR
jgi:hypothetical protein